MEMAGSRITAE